MPPANPKNYTDAAASDLGLGGGLGAPAEGLDAEEEKKKKLLQQQRERMGMDGSSVFGMASMSLFGDAGLK